MLAPAMLFRRRLAPARLIRRNPAKVLAMKSRSDTYDGLAKAICKERLPGHAVLRGLVLVLDGAVDVAQNAIGESVTKGVKQAISLLAEWCDGSGNERDLVAARGVIYDEGQAYIRMKNEQMEYAFARKAAGKDPRFPRETFLYHLRAATSICLGLAPDLMPRDESCQESWLRDALRYACATHLILSGDRDSMEADRAAGRTVAQAFRAGVRSAPLQPPRARYVLIPPKTQRQLDYEDQLRRERFMGAMGCSADGPSATLLGCPVPPPEDDDAGHRARVAESALDDLGLVRRYDADEVLEARRNPSRRRRR